MVIGPVIQGIKVGIKITKADQKLLQALGYSKEAAMGISQGIFAGGIANYFKSDNGIEPDALPQKPNGSSSNKSNQARVRQFKYSGRKRKRCVCNSRSRRRSYSKRY